MSRPVGFGWITDGRAIAESGTSECLLSLQVGTTTEVDDLVGRVDAAGGRVVSGPEQKAWGYTGTFADPDEVTFGKPSSRRSDLAGESDAGARNLRNKTA